VGCKSATGVVRVKELAHSRLEPLSTEVAGSRTTGEYHAGFLHEWNDLHLVYGENLEKLKSIKTRLDPANRFNKGIDLFKS
jgi:FAD/FMN-containing dehydrogenase